MSAHRDTAIWEQQMLKIAKEAILDSGDFLSLDQTAQQLGLLPSDVNKWKAEGQIFSIQHAGCSLFPKYAFHNNVEHKPVPSFEVILEVMRPKKDGWGNAFWFASSNGFLGGRRPQEMLYSGADKVLLAAIDEVSGITHGKMKGGSTPLQ
jgi:hypothetical protein